jgi:hypothetical protein
MSIRTQVAGALMTLTVIVPALARAEGSAKPDAVLEWNAIMLTTVGTQNPFAQARFAAITQLAVFEAVNACTERYAPYLGTVIAPAGASSEAAAVAAAHGVLKHYFPANAAVLDAARGQSLSRFPDDHAKMKGIAVGEAAALAMITARVGDGAVPPETFVPGTTDPGVWQPTPPGYGPGILLPFAIERSTQFRVSPPPALTSKRYARDYNEVKALGSAVTDTRPQDRTDVARFFAVVGAVHAWNSAAQQLSRARHRSISQNARAFALLNMAINDGLVASMESKYFHTLWRPVTALGAGDRDGSWRTEPDADWLPLVTTPAFPSYPSAHASASYAARHICEWLFGRRHIYFKLSHPGVPGLFLHYGSFRSLTQDIDDARVYGGIHFRFDQEAGAWQGRHVGAYVARHSLRRVRDHQR